MAEARFPDSARFGWAALVAALGALVAYLLVVLTPIGQQVENLALLGAREEFRELRTESLTELHEISALSFALAIALVVAIAFLRRKPVLAATAAGVMVSAVLATELVKRVLIRPELIEAPGHWVSNSFPSGHVAVAVAVSIGAVLVVPYALRPAVTLGAAIYAAAIAQAVGIAGWHRLSDVIGAALVVLAVSSLALLWLTRAGRVEPFVKPRRIGFTLVALVLGGAALIFGGGGLMGLSQLLPVPSAPTAAELRLAYTTSLVLGVAAIGLVFLAFLWLIRPYAIDEPPEA